MVTQTTVLAVTDDMVLPFSSVPTLMKELGKEGMEHCDPVIITQASTINQFPLESSTVDAVLVIYRSSDFSSHTMYHEFFRILKPGGVVLVCMNLEGETIELQQTLQRRVALAGFLEPQSLDLKSIRLGKKRLREARTLAVDYLILLLAGIYLGTLAKVSDETFGAMGYTYTVIDVSLLCKITALRSFSLDKLHYWRESRAGMSNLAYFLTKDTVYHFNTIVKPLVYLSMFYFFNNPRSTVTDNYVVLICLVYCVTGIAYAMAILFKPGPAQLCCSQLF